MLKEFISFAVAETGYNHIKADPVKACEDAAGSYDDDLMSICVVADGHGSDNYPRTDRGSRYAVQAAVGQIKEFVNSIYNPYPEDTEKSFKESEELIAGLLNQRISETHPLRSLAQSILAKWYELIEEDYSRDPFKEDELINVSDRYRRKYLSEHEQHVEKAYGSTLIAYTVTDKFSFGLQIGDGKCVVIDKKGNFEEPIPWDENCQLNITTSICDSDAIEEFRFYVTPDSPAAVFCGSDGIDDSYAKAEEVYALYRSVLKIFIEQGREVGENEIKEYLPILTKKGSGDDVSIAFVMEMEQVKRLTSIFELQAKIFETSNLLNVKKHALLVNEEKEKALNQKSELNTKIMPGNRSQIDIDIICQINDLRRERERIESEIIDLQERLNDFTNSMDALTMSLDSQEESRIQSELSEPVVCNTDKTKLNVYEATAIAIDAVTDKDEVGISSIDNDVSDRKLEKNGIDAADSSEENGNDLVICQSDANTFIMHPFDNTEMNVERMPENSNEV